ncbi:helix-turn-helix transcriptional regulator [Paenibacillus sp. Marseille-P2973]|uniref:HTH cro/C1-type domain-containing protein n=1 Tax=Paenibacillus vini TaxID=1476024 RepID=A0ABQ4M7E1_9BACL|nr:helix-turn-helix transcriptional regulator [Paenibacillus sp. Marseille-P2973]GIP51355.1 hypothetical protein J42TS3_03900 [Paenibacillus vini]
MNSHSILSELNLFMKRNELSVSQLAKKLDFNVGTVSYILSGTRKLTIDQLDSITEVLGYPRGHFYTNYIREYLDGNRSDWRRIRPLLLNCAELDQLDCIQDVVNLLLDHLIYAGPLFDMAEELFQAGNYKAAEILYENVADSERKQHSERLAMCQYRLFKIRVGKDQMLNFKTVCQFEPYVDRLDEVFQIEALKDLANVYRSLQQWDNVETFTREMENKAKILYFHKPGSERVFLEYQNKLGRPMFTYIAYASLLYACVAEGRGDYDLALKYTYEYADLSWVRESDKDTEHWKLLFAEWAQANIFANRIMSGDSSVLPDYVDYIETKPDEIITALLNMLFAANRHHFDLNSVLLKFDSEIKAFAPQKNQLYRTEIMFDYYDSFLYELTLYYLRTGDFENGFTNLLQGLDFSCKINNEQHILKYVGLFEEYRDQASSEIHLSYNHLIRKVCAAV